MVWLRIRRWVVRPFFWSLAAAAFVLLCLRAFLSSDLIPELQGRFPIRVELEALTEADFVRILTEPETALTKQYTACLLYTSPSPRD